MSTKPKRGRIVNRYSVVCGACGTEDDLNARSNPSKAALALGWCWTSDTGWICPNHFIRITIDGTIIEDINAKTGDQS